MDTPRPAVYPDTPETLEKGDSKVHLLDSESSPVQPVPPTRPRRSIVKHPWIIFGTVALIWLVYSCTKHALHRPYLVWSLVGGKTGPPPPPDADYCVGSSNWTTYYDHPGWAIDYPHGAETFFSLPVDSDALYLISRGAYQHGLVNIKTSTEASDSVDVRVRVAYFTDDALERATVCQLQREEGENGLGIFTPPFGRPHHEGPEDRLQFHVTLTLPAGKEGPLSVKNLETNMPNYVQSVADLHGYVLFDTVSLASANGPLSVESISCNVCQFSSLNGDIDGHFIASHLDLHTANGVIVPTVSLIYREGEDPSHLTIYTANGEIGAEVSLISEARIGGEFEVDAKSKNGAVGVKFTTTPVDSVLRCHAETAVGNVGVELDSAFEGTYSLQTLLGSKDVSQRDVEDPSGRGRQRTVSQNKAIGRVEGEVKWVERDGSSAANEGYVVLKSIVQSVELIV